MAGLGLGPLGLGLSRGAGGSGLSMQLGINLTQITEFGGYHPFANVLWHANRWEKVAGTGSFTQEYGVLNASVSTDTFRAAIANGGIANLPNGTYTVLNPDSLKIGIGWYNSPSKTGWTTATQFTYTKTDDELIFIHAEGSVTNTNGPIRVIWPNRLTEFQAGNPWSPDFLGFIESLNLKTLRFMDWTATNTGIVENWSDIPTTNAIMLNSKYTKMAAQHVPYAMVVDLCNRLNIDPWLCLPPMATDAYVDTLATYMRDNLNSNLNVWWELGNETWNPGSGFNNNRVWVELYYHTRYTATPNIPIDGWTRAAHGLATNDLVNMFDTIDNYTSTNGTVGYRLGTGTTLTVEVVDADNFKLWDGGVGATLVPPTATTTKITYKKRVEAGKTASVDINQGLVSKAFWDRIDAIFPRARSKHVMPTQMVSTSVTNGRLAPTGVRAATDVVAGAPYYQGDWWCGVLEIASGQLTPKAWSRNGSTSVRIAVYANGSTPTLAEVAAGTGTGYIAHRDINIASNDATTYTFGSAITGLTDGVTYTCFGVLTDINGHKWMASANATVSAVTSNVSIYDSYTNMAKRARKDIVDFIGPFVTAQKAASAPAAFAAYECSADYFGGNLNAGTLPEIHDWRTGWTQSPEAGEVLGMFYQTMAAYGLTSANQYSDVSKTPGVFNIAESLTDTADYRYQEYLGFNGRIPITSKFTVADIIRADIALEPSYPTVVETFPNATLTYSIYNGDPNNNFTIVGNELRIANGYGINWAVPNARLLIIEASNGLTSDFFNVSFATGSAWYQADAKFAYSPIADADSTALDPQVGNSLALINGTAATNSGGLLTFDGTKRYSNSIAFPTTFDRTIPHLIAVVIDKNANSTSGLAHLYIGGTAFVNITNGTGADSTRIRMVGWTGSTTATGYTTSGATPAGPQVHWTYYDGTGAIKYGINQTENTASALSLAYTGNIPRDMFVGGNNAGAQSLAKLGSIQIVNRAGMTLGDALAAVQKMQTLHGI
jgi:hypothetical protein